MEKIAIPTKNNYVDSHFGHTDYFSIYNLQDGLITESEVIESNQGCGCKSNIIGILKQKGVSVMLAGNMGEGAYQKLQAAGIEVIRGCRGKVDSVLQMYASGDLKDNESHCHSHGNHRHELSR